MIKKSYFYHTLIPMMLIVLALSSTSLSAPGMPFAPSSLPQQQEPIPTPIPIQPTRIPLDRVLPPVGSNAGLLIGVSVLVLIIIGGVVWSSRWGKKH